MLFLLKKERKKTTQDKTKTAKHYTKQHILKTIDSFLKID